MTPSDYPLLTARFGLPHDFLMSIAKLRKLPAEEKLKILEVLS
jgi:hypothetical protein